ncbi:MAG: hypothetical protein R2867_13070 [Caldilineaceae bacterium]
MQVSNDGGFAGATWEPCVREKPGRSRNLATQLSHAPSIAASSDEAGNTSGVVQDDIILDVTAPSGSVAVVPSVALLRRNQV